MRQRLATMAALGITLLTLAQLPACGSAETLPQQSSSSESGRPCGPGRYNTEACKQWQYQNLGP
jgi:hypothetical protein